MDGWMNRQTVDLDDLTSSFPFFFQVFICLSLISVQLVMVSVWLLLEVPGTRRFTLPERRQTVILKCNVRDSSMLLSLGYDVLLVILCTV